MKNILEDILYKGKVLVLEDLINPTLQNYILNICQNDLAYSLSPSTNPSDVFKRVNNNVVDNIYDDFFFYCNLKNIFSTPNVTNYTNINLNIGHSLFTPLYLVLSHLNLNIKYEDILRTQINLQIPTPSNPGNDKHNTPHVDFPSLEKPYFTLIYYVNDCDGDTVFFDPDLSIRQKITPKKGKIALFNGNFPHTSSHPLLNNRYIISYSFSINPT